MTDQNLLCTQEEEHQAEKSRRAHYKLYLVYFKRKNEKRMVSYEKVLQPEFFFLLGLEINICLA